MQPRLKISGQLTFAMKARPEMEGLDGYWSSFLEAVKRSFPFLHERAGLHSFEGGTISLFHSEREDGRIGLTVRFEGVTKASFLDHLVEVSMKEFPECSISCSVKGLLDFEDLKRRTKAKCLSWLGETEEGSFSAEVGVWGQELRLTAYPKGGLLNVAGRLSRGPGVPSRILRELLYEHEEVMPKKTPKERQGVGRRLKRWIKKVFGRPALAHHRDL